MGGRRPPAMCDASRWELQHRPAAHARRLFGTATAVVTQTVPHHRTSCCESRYRTGSTSIAAGSTSPPPPHRLIALVAVVPPPPLEPAIPWRDPVPTFRHRPRAIDVPPLRRHSRHVRIDRAGSPRARFRIRDGRRPVAPPATVQAYSGHTKTDLARSATCGPTSSAASRSSCITRSPPTRTTWTSGR